MLGIVQQLKQSNLFFNVDIQDFIDEETITLLKIKAQLIDDSVLYIREISAIIFSCVSLSTCVDPEQNDFHLFCNKYAQNPLPPHMIEKFREIMKVFELT